VVCRCVVDLAMGGGEGGRREGENKGNTQRKGREARGTLDIGRRSIGGEKEANHTQNSWNSRRAQASSDVTRERGEEEEVHEKKEEEKRI